jgi:2,3-diaminopropionate biosynthesis protein SbnB
MEPDTIRILKADDILSLLADREDLVVETVRTAYEVHAAGASSLPHSTFLTFPNQPRDRIIALPAFLGEQFDVAGVKWIASFPENHALGMDRASAVIIVNSARTGRPLAIMEGSIVSAKRTAASAALAAQRLHGDRQPTHAGLIGCGLINFEITRFLLSVFPSITRLTLFDALPESAERFKAKAERQWGQLSISIAADPQALLGQAPLVSFATTAIQPHIDDLSMCAPGSTILHISLRDLTPDVILAADNVVDDVDHVARASTSIHLAEQQVGNRDFVRCSLADVTTRRATPRDADRPLTIFSPFGLGVLDLALSKVLLALAAEQQIGLSIDSFLPTSWLDR